MTPIIGIAGEAGSGKDTVAGFIKKYTKGSYALAQSDPMKQFAKRIFEFTDEQLWGPSECRNAEDSRFSVQDTWTKAELQMSGIETSQWVETVFDREFWPKAKTYLHNWFFQLQEHYGVGAGFKPMSPRVVLQTMGTEMGRSVDPNVWSKYAIKRSQKQLSEMSLMAPSDFVLITDIRFPNEMINLSSIGGKTVLVINPDSKELSGGVKGHASEASLKQIPKHWYDYVLVNDKKDGILALENKVHELVQKLKGRVK